MRFLSKLRLRTKLLLLAGLAGLIVVIAVANDISTLRARMVEDRIDKLRAVSQSASLYAASLDARVKSGAITQSAADELLGRYIHAVRFDQGDGYLALSSLDGMVKFHGVDPTRENKPTIAKDPDGHTLPELVAGLLKTGVTEGVVSFLIPKPGQTVPVEKLAYIVKIDAWQAYLVAGAYVDDLDAELNQVLERQLAWGAALLLMLGGLAYLINRDIAGSLGALSTSMSGLAAGDLTLAIPGLDRRDEAGAMAQAVDVFRQTMLDAGRLRHEQEQLKAKSAEERRQLMHGLANRFGTGVGGVVQSMGQAVGELQTIARKMAETSHRTTEQAVTVASASEQATQNVQTVASAAEELAASIREINQLVTRAGGMIEDGVQQTLRSNEQVKSLTGTAQKIGDVVGLISNIAGQTNLLALNATIEAARAGDAGKGFAVVAAEVKLLATQTARATEEIAAQIKAIQDATLGAAQSIQGVTNTIARVAETATAISAAVEQQGAATQEISRNVLQAAQGTQEVSASIAAVSQAARQNNEAASEVTNSADLLSANGGTLKSQVEAFLLEVRAA